MQAPRLLLSLLLLSSSSSLLILFNDMVHADGVCGEQSGQGAAGADAAPG